MEFLKSGKNGESVTVYFDGEKVHIGRETSSGIINEVQKTACMTAKSSKGNQSSTHITARPNQTNVSQFDFSIILIWIK